MALFEEAAAAVARAADKTGGQWKGVVVSLCWILPKVGPNLKPESPSGNLSWKVAADSELPDQGRYQLEVWIPKSITMLPFGQLKVILTFCGCIWETWQSRLGNLIS